jgi:hypothetical protein
MSVAAIFELETPFLASELASLNYEQTADVFVITHMNHPMQRLRRFDHNNWILDDAPIGTQIAAPTGVTVTVTNPSSGTDYVATVKYYIVTAVNDAGQESQQSIGANGVNDLSLKGNFNTITWDDHPGAVEYRIYEERSGTFGYLGSAKAGFMTFKDDNILADFSSGPPSSFNPFADDQNPATVTFHESRLWVGRTITRPNALFGSQTDDIFNFDRSSPLRATDSLALALRARRVNTIRHLVPMKDLTVMTSDMIFSIRSTDGGAITPTAVRSVPEGHRGVGTCRPEVVGDIAFYGSVAASSIHTLGYTYEKDGYRGNNLSVFAQHLFDRFQILGMAWTDQPANVLWARRDDGKLLALTWQQEQDVWGWTLCETDGVVESICSVPEVIDDTLYAVIRRTVGGEQVRFVERLAEAPWKEEGWSDLASAVVLDCAVVVESDTPFNDISGYDEMEGRAVACLADGVVIRDRTIVGGKLSAPLPNSVTKLVIGLPYVSTLRTLPKVGEAQGAGSTKNRRQSVANATVNFMNTCGFGAGLLIGAGLKKTDNPQYSMPVPPELLTVTPPLPYTGAVETNGVEGSDWRRPVVTLQQTDPLPMVVLGIEVDLETGS